MSSHHIRTAVVSALAALTAVTATACTATASASPDGKSPETPHWSYEGATGPEHWASLSEDFETCEKGREQSPVDLTEDVAVETDTPVTVHYKPVTAELVNNGHTVQANVSAGSSIVVDGTTYQLRQFHFHLPSEHTEDGGHAAMEMHFVHEDSKGGLAVLGVLMRTAKGHSAFTDLWKHLPAEEGGQSHITRPVDLTRFLPGDRDQYRYEGSLTTPPCTEGVKWTVLEDQVRVTPRQVAAYRELFPRSNRPVQPRNDREVDHVDR
ncbi:carbonic anhydrase family protein [Streptomyces sp. NPDC013433]|uniref:carbonic anhydrase n=1 Tax=Streptomyces sp. NPDC013433 TaxID=3155604 RepID=UPI0034516BF2